VLAVGDVNIDLVLTGLSNFPCAEQEAVGTGFDVLVGGQTATFARTLTKLGEVVTFVGRVGDDEYGLKAFTTLQEDRVDTAGLSVDANLKTGFTVVLSTGVQRALATFPGSIGEVSREDVHNGFLRVCDHMHVGSYYLQRKLQPDLASLFEDARALNVSTSLDSGWDPSGEWGRGIIDVLDHVDIFLPNKTEALHISKADNIDAALTFLLRKAATVVIKCGPSGCLAGTNGRKLFSPGYRVDIVDVTSAGDAFNAGFIYAMLNSWGLEEAARFANACGAIAVTKPGSSGILSSVQEVEEFMVTHQPRNKTNA
jgi:sugar/nucleoside kinase (ribokinase family)